MIDKQIETMIPVCKMCGRKLGQFVGMLDGEPYIICSSDYIEDWPYCYSCMIEHCCATNCYGCEFNPGDYHNCKFLNMKMFYLKEEN